MHKKKKKFWDDSPPLTSDTRIIIQCTDFVLNMYKDVMEHHLNS